MYETEISKLDPRKRRLFFFPELPDDSDGYGLAVKKDVNSFSFNSGDVVVFLSDRKMAQDHPVVVALHAKGAEVKQVLRNRSKLYIIGELVSLRHPSHFYGFRYHKELMLPEIVWEYVFCGDVIFYNYAKNFLKYRELCVRFHNLWSKLILRRKWGEVTTGFKFWILNLGYGSKLEQSIALDNQCSKVFISDSDRDFFKLITGQSSLITMPVIDSSFEAKVERDYNVFHDHMLRIVWFGTVVSHNVYGLKWFIDKVYKPLYNSGFPVELHLFGRNTQLYNQPKYNIFGIGRFNGDGLPLNGNALFINPDLLGGGVKMKMQFMLENGLHIITTPFGMDGYEGIGAMKNLRIVQPNNWINELKEMIANLKNGD